MNLVVDDDCHGGTWGILRHPSRNPWSTLPCVGFHRLTDVLHSLDCPSRKSQVESRQTSSPQAIRDDLPCQSLRLQWMGFLPICLHITDNLLGSFRGDAMPLADFIGGSAVILCRFSH